MNVYAIDHGNTITSNLVEYGKLQCNSFHNMQYTCMTRDFDILMLLLIKVMLLYMNVYAIRSLGTTAIYFAYVKFRYCIGIRC